MLTRQIVSFLTLLVVFSGCASPAPTDGPSEASVGPELQIHGALKAMFHQGQTSEMVNLKSLTPNPNLYAVGAISELRGEITIIAGKTYLSYPESESGVRTEVVQTTDEGATLLVATEVTRWQSAVIENSIPFDQLDDKIAELAKSIGVDTEKPFAFKMKGRFDDIQWHVIDGTRLVEGGDSHEDHLKASIQQEKDQIQGTLIGFFSSHHQGVFTHMSSNTHIHCVIDEPLSSGHVDRVQIPAGTTIMISQNLKLAAE